MLAPSEIERSRPSSEITAMHDRILSAMIQQHEDEMNAAYARAALDGISVIEARGIPEGFMLILPKVSTSA